MKRYEKQRRGAAGGALWRSKPKPMQQHHIIHLRCHKQLNHLGLPELLQHLLVIHAVARQAPALHDC